MGADGRVLKTINALTPLGWNPEMKADNDGATEGNHETHEGHETEPGGPRNPLKARKMGN